MLYICVRGVMDVVFFAWGLLSNGYMSGGICPKTICQWFAHC